MAHICQGSSLFTLLPRRTFSETEKGSGSDGLDPFSLLHTPRQRVSTLRLEGILVGYKDRLRFICPPPGVVPGVRPGGSWVAAAVPSGAFERSDFDRGWTVAKAGTAVTANIAAISAATISSTIMRLIVSHLLSVESRGRPLVCS